MVNEIAYMNQEMKAEIRAELKKVLPKSWKWSLGVKHYSTIVLTISKADVNLLKDDATYADINTFHLGHHFSGEVLAVFEKIVKALNLNNHDNSDVMTDYFDVGHYVNLNIGKYNKPFEII